MIETMVRWAPDVWVTGPAPDLAALLDQGASLRQENAALRAEKAALRAENAVLHERVQEPEARLGQTSANSSRHPSSAPPSACEPLAAAFRPERGASPATGGPAAGCCRTTRRGGRARA